MPLSPLALPTECDIVMEGGVTSGVVYPAFVHRLAQYFRLRNIGGASVGAVAAACAAAAQYRCNAGGLGRNGGFSRLKLLPRWLARSDYGDHSNLFALFQPCPDLQPHFRVLQAALNRSNHATRIAAIAGALLWRFRSGAVLGAAVLLLERYVTQTLPFVSLQAASAADAWLAGAGCVAALLRMMLAGAGLQLLLSAWSGLRHNRCGICSGLTEPGNTAPGLTNWLHRQIQDMANLPLDGKPLTFGDLRNSRYPIELAFVTTGLSELSSHRLPHAGKDMLFRASEMRALLPAPVVAYLVTEAKKISVHPATLEKLRAIDPNVGNDQRDLYFLPSDDAWPVLLAARLSLSFPLLLQAVPLYRLRGMQQPGQPGYGAVMRVWFSDGGLTSNFPIHFFDALLPQRPTFGIALQSTLPADAADAERAYLPGNNSQGWAPDYIGLGDHAGKLSPLAFGRALLQTMRIWRHEALRRTPGFRDRVVLVRHRAEEGGLNLDMPKEAIRKMSVSGVLAADKLIERFLSPSPAVNGWLNHRWIRLRTAAGLLQPEVALMQQAWSAPGLQPTYRALWHSGGRYAGHAYRLDRGQLAAGTVWLDAVMALPAVPAAASLAAGVPKPAPVLAVSPRQT